MVLLAKRVRAFAPTASMASTSCTPSERAAFSTCAKISWQAWRVSGGSLIGAADLDGAEPRGTGTVTRAHHLFGLSLAAVGRAPESPMLRPGDSGAGVPELRADAAVAGILEHADALAFADLPGDLAAELEIVALVVDRPALVGLHVDGVFAAAENFVQRLRAGLEADVGHADEGNARPAVGAHGSVGADLAYRRRGLARGHVADEQAVADNVRLLGRHALVIESEGSQTGTM